MSSIKEELGWKTLINEPRFTNSHDEVLIKTISEE